MRAVKVIMNGKELLRLMQFPEGAKIVDLRRDPSDFAYGNENVRLEMIITSDSFDEVSDGCFIPKANLISKIGHDGNAALSIGEIQN